MKQERSLIDLERRLDRVETALRRGRRQRRRYVRAGCAAGVLVFVASMLGAGPGPPQSVRARRFEVIANNGETVALMAEAPEGGGALTLTNGERRIVVMLRSMPDASGAMFLSDKNGFSLVDGGKAANGLGGLYVYDGQGQRMVSLTADADRRGAVRTWDETGTVLTEVASREDGAGRVRIFGEGDTLVEIPAAEPSSDGAPVGEGVEETDPSEAPVPPDEE